MTVAIDYCGWVGSPPTPFIHLSTKPRMDGKEEEESVRLHLGAFSIPALYLQSNFWKFATCRTLPRLGKPTCLLQLAHLLAHKLYSDHPNKHLTSGRCFRSTSLHGNAHVDRSGDYVGKKSPNTDLGGRLQPKAPSTCRTARSAWVYECELLPFLPRVKALHLGKEAENPASPAAVS